MANLLSLSSIQRGWTSTKSGKDPLWIRCLDSSIYVNTYSSFYKYQRGKFNNKWNLHWIPCQNASSNTKNTSNTKLVGLSHHSVTFDCKHEQLFRSASLSLNSCQALMTHAGFIHEPSDMHHWICLEKSWRMTINFILFYHLHFWTPQGSIALKLIPCGIEIFLRILFALESIPVLGHLYQGLVCGPSSRCHATTPLCGSYKNLVH